MQRINWLSWFKVFRISKVFQSIQVEMAEAMYLIVVVFSIPDDLMSIRKAQDEISLSLIS